MRVSLSVFACHCDLAYLHGFSCLWKAVIRHSSTTVPLPYTLPGTTPFGRLLTWLSHTAACLYFRLGLTRLWKAKASSLAHSGLSIVYCWQASEYVTKTMAQSRGLGPKFCETNCSEEKRLACFPLVPFSFFSSWLIIWVRPTREDSLKQAAVQQKRGIWMKVTVC